MKTLIKDLTEGMTPIEWAGLTLIGLLGATFVVSFLYFVIAVITGDADLANASYGIADTQSW
jgi:hypothetical protein